jgi:hypothetical protein
VLSPRNRWVASVASWFSSGTGGFKNGYEQNGVLWGRLGASRCRARVSSRRWLDPV